MTIATITVTLPIEGEDTATNQEVLNALDNLAAVMLVQAEDGLWTLGSPEAEADEIENTYVRGIGSGAGYTVTVLNRPGRGFARATPVESEYGGHVEVYESSAASGPHIWVNVECPESLNDPTGPTKEAVAHLTLENATLLRDQLTTLIDNHYQLRS